MENEIKLFIKHLEGERKYSANTLSAYNSDLSQFLSFCRLHNRGVPVTMQSLNGDMPVRYVHELNEKKYAVSTIARKVAAAKSFMRYLIESGRTSNDLTLQLASPHVQKAMPRPLTVAEVRRFLDVPTKLSTVEARRDKAILELLYATGLRASELMSLNVDDIDIRKHTVRCRGSNNRTRYLPVDAAVMRIVDIYLRDTRPRLLNNETETALILNRRGERLTRQGFWQIIQGYAEKAGLKDKVTPRSLRHSFAAHRLNGGTDIEVVQELLGHTHKSTTRVYEGVKSV